MTSDRPQSRLAPSTRAHEGAGRSRRAGLLVMLAALGFHCDSSCGAEEPAKAAAVSVASSVPPSGATGAVLLRVDELEVAQMSLGANADSRPLSAWLGHSAPLPRAWAYLAAYGGGGRKFWTQAPASRYPNTEARLYRDANGKLSLGLFRLSPAPAQGPEPVAGLRNISSVEIFTRLPASRTKEARQEPHTAILEIEGGGGIALTEKALAHVPKRPLPHGRGEAWALIDIIRSQMGERVIGSVEVLAADGSVSALDLSTVQAPEAGMGYFLKIAHGQELRLQHWQLDRARPERVHRDMIRIRVRPADPGSQ